MTFRPTRRQALAAAAAALAVSRMPAQAIQRLSLGEAGAAAGLLVGAAYDQEVIDNPPYGQLVARESRIATIANALKFDWLRPHGPEADFTHADRMVQLGLGAGVILRGSAPIWNDWPPAWLAGVADADLRRLFDSHIDEVIGRYAGRVAYWDLVNEPFQPLWYDSAGWRQGPWFKAYGKDYIGRAFHRAAAADPKARLFLNEAALEQDDNIGTSMRPHVLDELRKLLDAGTPIHGFGVESHLMPSKPHDYAAFADYLGEIGRLGLEIHITELDVSDDGFPDDPAERDAAVAAVYRDYLGAVLSVPQVKAVIFWTLSEPYGYPYWVWQNQRGGAGRAPRTLLYDEQLQPRPARAAALEAFAARGRSAPKPPPR